ncbi:MAG: signal peptidase I [Clostridia bacterium]|nr:signal peptidase I [Clostridia bacterium]
MENKAVPTSAEIENELKRERHKLRYKKTVKSTVFALITAVAAAVLVATLWLPVLQIYGSSMEPTLAEGNIVISVKDNKHEIGDVVAFYYGNKVLIKRYIAGPGQWVEIADDGTISVDGVPLEEKYIDKKAIGICDLEFPFQVPDNSHFLVGDHRETSVDSRHSSVGCISDEQMIGKIIARVWPLDSIGPIR